jgi:hypothetical protein
MSRRPVLLRLLLPFALLIALVVCVCGTVIWWAGQRTVRLQQIRDLDRLSSLVGRWLDPASQAVTPEQIGQIKDASNMLGTRVTLIDGSGRVLLDTHANPSQMENHNQRPEIAAARTGRVGTSVRYSGTIKEPNVYVARLLDPARPDGVILRLSYPKSTWAHLATPAWMIVGAGVVSALVVMLWLAWLL